MGILFIPSLVCISFSHGINISETFVCSRKLLASRNSLNHILLYTWEAASVTAIILASCLRPLQSACFEKKMERESPWDLPFGFYLWLLPEGMYCSCFRWFWKPYFIFLLAKYFCLEALAASLPTLLSSAHTDALCILAQGRFRFIVRETFKWPL